MIGMREREWSERAPPPPTKIPCTTWFRAAGDHTHRHVQPSSTTQPHILDHHYDPNTSNPRRVSPGHRNYQANPSRQNTGSQPFRERNAYWRKRSEHTTSYYFTNFPDNWSAKPIWELFAKYGVVNDLFIPSKRNAQGKRFGFVRFQEVEDELSLEGKLDQILIGQAKLSVNLSRFERKPAYGDSAHLRNKVFTGMRVNARENTFLEQTNRSYLHALKNTRTDAEERKADQEQGQADRSVPEFKVSEENMEWLKHCYVGALRNPADITSLQGKLQMEGYGLIKTTPMGGGLVLLQGESKAKSENLLSVSNKWVESWFIYVRPWSTRDVAAERTVWISCSGIPLHAWSENFFRFLTSEMGSFIRLDEDTERKQSFEVGRVQIRTHDLGPIDKTTKVRINGEVFTILMEEEKMHHQGVSCHSRTRRNRRARRRHLSWTSIIPASQEDSSDAVSDTPAILGFHQSSDMSDNRDARMYEELHNRVADSTAGNQFPKLDGEFQPTDKAVHSRLPLDGLANKRDSTVGHIHSQVNPVKNNGMLGPNDSHAHELNNDHTGAAFSHEKVDYNNELNNGHTGAAFSHEKVDYNKEWAPPQMPSQLPNFARIGNDESGLPASGDPSNSIDPQRPTAPHEKKKKKKFRKLPTIPADFWDGLQTEGEDGGFSDSGRSKAAKSRPRRSRNKRRSSGSANRSHHSDEFSNSLSSSHIAHRNSVIKAADSVAEARRIWEEGKTLGITARGDEEIVIANLSRMEDREKPADGGQDQVCNQLGVGDESIIT